MSLKILERKILTNSEAKKILDGLNRELNQFQRRALDYASNFSKIDPEKALELANKLAETLGISIREATQIVNCLPESVAELRTMLPRHRIIDTERLQDALQLIKRYL